MPTQYRTRADLVQHPLFAGLGKDCEGNPRVFANCYKCDDGHETVIWHDTWSCACDDTCPVCGISYAAESEWIGPDDPALIQLWDMLPDAAGSAAEECQRIAFAKPDADTHSKQNFTDQESAHLLAALRLWQRIASDVVEIPEAVVATRGGQFALLSRLELNALCRRIGDAV